MSVSLLLYPLICAATLHGPDQVPQPVGGPNGDNLLERIVDKRIQAHSEALADALEGKASANPVGGVWVEAIARIVAILKKIIAQIATNAANGFLAQLWIEWRSTVYLGVGGFLAVAGIVVGGCGYVGGRLGRRA